MATPPAQSPHPATTISGSTDPKTTSPLSSTHSLQQQKSQTSQPTRWRRILDVINWKPKRVRWDPQKPPKFNMAMNVLFGFAGAFTVADL